MAQAVVRVIVAHLDASKNKIKHYEPEQFLVNATAIADAGGQRPDPSDVKTRLSNNSKLRGSDIIILGYANVDKEHQNAPAVLN